MKRTLLNEKKLLIGLSIITLVSYYFPIPFLFLPVYLGIILVFIFHKTDALRVVIPVFFLLFSQYERFTINLYFFYALLIIPLLFIDFIKHRKLRRLGAFGLALIVLVDAAILSGFNAPSFFAGVEGVITFALIFLAYLYFINALEYKKDLFARIARLFMALSFVVTTQLFMNLLTHEIGLVRAFSERQVTLGYLPTSTALITTLVAIPLVAYLLFIDNKKWPYLLMLIFMYGGIFITLNRALMLTALFYIIILAPYMLIKIDDRRRLLKETLIILVSLSLVLVLINEATSFITPLIQTLNLRDLSLVTDRIGVFVDGFNTVRTTPFLGQGGLFQMNDYLSDIGIPSDYLPSTFIQAQALGLIGIAGFLYLQVKKVKVLMQTESVQRYFVGTLIVVTLLIGGLFSPVYFTVFYLMYLFLVLSALELKAYTVER